MIDPAAERDFLLRRAGSPWAPLPPSVAGLMGERVGRHLIPSGLPSYDAFLIPVTRTPGLNGDGQWRFCPNLAGAVEEYGRQLQILLGTGSDEIALHLAVDSLRTDFWATEPPRAILSRTGLAVRTPAPAGAYAPAGSTRWLTLFQWSDSSTPPSSLFRSPLLV